jgi:hypothetical protein
MSACLSVCRLPACLSVCPHEQLESHWKNFREIYYLSIPRKSAEKIQVQWKSDKKNE